MVVLLLIIVIRKASRRITWLTQICKTADCKKMYKFDSFLHPFKPKPVHIVKFLILTVTYMYKVSYTWKLGEICYISPHFIFSDHLYLTICPSACLLNLLTQTDFWARASLIEELSVFIKKKVPIKIGKI